MINWISVKDAMPAVGTKVRVKRDAGTVSNPLHPGYGNDGKWEEDTFALNDSCFACDIESTGHVTHWKLR